MSENARTEVEAMAKEINAREAATKAIRRALPHLEPGYELVVQRGDSGMLVVGRRPIAGERQALIRARAALHRACLQIGSTEGYRADFDAINAALAANESAEGRAEPCALCHGDGEVRSHGGDSTWTRCPDCNGSGGVAPPARWECPNCGPLHDGQFRHEAHSQIPHCLRCGTDVDPA